MPINPPLPLGSPLFHAVYPHGSPNNKWHTFHLKFDIVIFKIYRLLINQNNRFDCLPLSHTHAPSNFDPPVQRTMSSKYKCCNTLTNTYFLFHANILITISFRFDLLNDLLTIRSVFFI